MTWLHTWTGLVVGWVLFAIFLTGTLAFFQHEITQWMQPEVGTPATPNKALAQAQQYLEQHAPDSSRWSITLPDERATTTTLFWRDPNASGRGFRRAVLDGDGNAVTTRETRGGYFLYRFHFDLHYISVFWARWLVGICSMFMLVAIVSGIIIHKKIFKDFFTLQWRKGYKSWLDGHTITSVLALPFHLMITYTGLVTLMLMYLSSAISMNYDNRGEFFAELQGATKSQEMTKETPTAAPLTDLQALYQQARQAMNDAPISFVGVNQPGKSNAEVTFNEAPTQSLMSSYRTATYSGVSGELKNAQPITNNAELARRTMVNLHAGRFADTGLRWLYFFSGVLGTLMVASGLILWFEKRQQKLLKKGRLPFGHRLVSGLNAGFVMGLPLGIACYFISNRLLPTAMVERADWEIHCLFLAWLMMIVHPLIFGYQKTWRHGAIANAIAFLALPFINLVSVNQHVIGYLVTQDWVKFSVELGMILTGLLFALITRQLLRRSRTNQQVLS